MGLEKIGVAAVVDGIGTYLNDMDKLNKATSNAADATEKHAQKSEAMTKALQGMGKIIAGLGLASIFTEAIQEASEVQQNFAQLDAVLKSTSASTEAAAKAGGHWESSISQTTIDDWTKGLKTAQETYQKLQDKLTAGIQLSKEESKTLIDSANEVAHYQQSLDDASKAKQIWITDTKKVTAAIHLERQAYIDISEDMQKITRYSHDVVLGAENVLLTFRHIDPKMFKDVTVSVLDLSTAMKQDLRTSALQIGKALEDPVTGMTALRRAGVQFTDAQEETIKKLVETNQLAKAQALILKELQIEFGGSAVAAGKTFAGKLDILRNKFADVEEEIGNALLPTLTTIIDKVSEFIDKLGPAAPAIVAIAGALGLLTIAIGPIGTMLSVLIGPIGLIIGGIIALGAAFNSNFLGIRDLVTSVWNGIQPIIADIVGFFQNLFAGVDPGAMLTDLKQRLKMALEQMFDSLGIDYRIVDKVFTNLQKIVDWFTLTAVPAVLDFISGTVIPGIQDFIDTIARIWTDVQPFLQDLYDWFVTDALPLIGRVIDNFQVNIAQPLIDLLKGLWEVVQPALAQLYDWFVTTGLPAIQGIANDFWQKVMLPLVQLLTTIWDKVKDPLQSVANFFAQNGPIIGFIVGVVISGAFNFLLGIIKEVVKWLGDAIVSLNKFIDIAGRTDWNKPQDVLNFWQSLSNVPVLRDFLHLVPNLGVPLKDAGGSYSANQPYLVGTGAQPELFMPSSPGFAIPNFSMGALAAAMPISSPSSYAYNNTYNNQSQMGDVNFNGVGGMDDARRRYAVLRAMGRVR